jgi:hypothetical protein
MKRYEVTCLKCKTSAFVRISENHEIMFEGGVSTNLLAGRWRKSMDFGWECTCGNDNRISKQEQNEMNELVKGTPQQIADIVKSLDIADNKQFRLVSA